MGDRDCGSYGHGGYGGYGYGGYDGYGYGQCKPCKPCPQPPQCPRPNYATELFACLSTDREVTAPTLPSNCCACPCGHFRATLTACCDRVFYCGLFFNMTSDVTSAHIHQAAVGVDGPIVKTLEVHECKTHGGYYSGKCAKTFWFTSGCWGKCDDDEPLTGMLADYLICCGLYVNVHTVDNPTGEIRGQIAQYCGVSQYGGCGESCE